MYMYTSQIADTWHHVDLFPGLAIDLLTTDKKG